MLKESVINREMIGLSKAAEEYWYHEQKKLFNEDTLDKLSFTVSKLIIFQSRVFLRCIEVIYNAKFLTYTLQLFPNI